MTDFISLFAGAGGLDLGLSNAGWHCLYACDNDKAAIVTLRANRGGATGPHRLKHAEPILAQADVAALKGSAILDQVGRRKGAIALLAGGPPCQSWSSAGHQLGFEDPRGRLMDDYIRLAREFETRWLLLENVRGLLTARGPSGRPGEALEHIRRRLFSEAGYQTEVALLNAADYGVPQRRVRLFLLGYRSGDAPKFPIPTHAQCKDARGLSTWVTLGDCISALAPPARDEILRPSAKLAPLLAVIRPGSGVRSPGKKETTRPGGHWGYKQGAFVADLQLPARTVTANAQQDWIRDPQLGLRKLSVRECAALQSFPADWKFVGSQADQRRLIGNAVPPLLAKALGEALRAHVLAQPNAKAPMTAARELQPLPEKLAAAIRYTQKEEDRNGASRRLAPQRRRVRASRIGAALSA
jgi:DNA (cytosine-5)-methyltransferase 1